MNDDMERDLFLDHALESLPPQPLPPHFVDGVMARVERQRAAQWAAERRFRLRPADLVAPVLVTLLLMATAALAAAGVERELLPPPADLLATYPQLLLITLLVAAELGLAGVAAVWLFEE